MHLKASAAVIALALFAARADAIGRTKVTEPLAPGLIGAVDVVDVVVTIGDKAKTAADKLDAKAEAQRVAAASADAAMPAGRPDATAYATLPLAAMLPLEVEDAAHAWGLTHGRPVRLATTVDSVRLPDAVVSTLVGVSDELRGSVVVLDAATGARLGAFIVVVVEGHAGPLGLAIRGSGLREKLAADFALHVARQLSASRHKPKAA